jgi:hypothetical protein
MVTTSPRPRHPKAYTILESFVVIAILAIFSWVAFALLKHDDKAGDSTAADPPASSADNGAEPAKPPAGSDAPEE